MQRFKDSKPAERFKVDGSTMPRALRGVKPGQEASVHLESTLTCPKCGHQAIETMPTDACQFFYDCRGCGIRLKPLPGDCCVFCSYGSVPCPPIQGNANCCAQDRPK
jgi:hypothetical protein